MIGIDFFSEFKDDPRYSDFAAIAEPLDQQMRVLTAEAEMEERVSYDCIAGGDHGDAKAHAVAAHGKTVAAHELGREIERAARAILRVVQATSSNYIGKLAPTPGRRAFLCLRRSSEMTLAEQKPYLVMITLSPDGAAWACLVSERVLRDPFPEAHDLIAESTQWSYMYSNINAMPFPPGEAAIRRSSKLWRRYQSRWGNTNNAVPRCPDCGTQLRNGTCDKHGPKSAGVTA